MTIAGLWRYDDWRHVATGCTAVVWRDSDVISSYRIYASCFSAMMWGQLCEMFVIVRYLLS